MSPSREDELAAGIRKVTVVFTRDFPPYRRSDVATFEQHEAMRLLDLRVCKRYKQGDKVPKPTVHQVAVGSKSVRTGAL